MRPRAHALWATFFAVSAIVLTGCQKESDVALKNSGSRINNTVVGNTPPTYSDSHLYPADITTSQNPALLAPQTLRYEVQGVGNHSRHICVPAKKKLHLRVMPHANWDPLLPAGSNIRYPTGNIVYDGSPAFYGRLRIAMSVSTSPAWDYLANNDSWSVTGDYSKYLGPAAPKPAPTGRVIATPYITNNNQYNNPALPLVTPEYKDIWILGSDPDDALCSYWEKNLGKCGNISKVFTESNTASCGDGEAKVLIKNIVSDYPCNYDQVNWCKGAPLQTVTDYQKWSVTIEAATENTGSITN